MSVVVYVGYVCRNAVRESDQTVDVLPGDYLIRALSAWNAGRSCDVCCVENSEKTQSISSASQEIPRTLWNPKFYYCVYTRPPLLLIVSQLNTGERLKYCLRFVTNQCLVQDALSVSLVTD